MPITLEFVDLPARGQPPSGSQSPGRLLSPFQAICPDSHDTPAPLVAVATLGKSLMLGRIDMKFVSYVGNVPRSCRGARHHGK